MKFILLIISLASFSSIANEFEFSTGSGSQYGGLIGGQFSLKTNSVKYYISIGYFGVSTGFQAELCDNSNHSLGLNLGGDIIWGNEGYLFATYDYHFNGFDQSGWVLGVGLGDAFGNKSDYEFNDVNRGNEIAWTINIGYKF